MGDKEMMKYINVWHILLIAIVVGFAFRKKRKAS